VRVKVVRFEFWAEYPRSASVESSPAAPQEDAQQLTRTAHCSRRRNQSRRVDKLGQPHHNVEMRRLLGGDDVSRESQQETRRRTYSTRTHRGGADRLLSVGSHFGALTARSSMGYDDTTNKAILPRAHTTDRVSTGARCSTHARSTHVTQLQSRAPMRHDIRLAASRADRRVDAERRSRRLEACRAANAAATRHVVAPRHACLLGGGDRHAGAAAQQTRSRLGPTVGRPPQCVRCATAPPRQTLSLAARSRELVRLQPRVHSLESVTSGGESLCLVLESDRCRPRRPLRRPLRLARRCRRRFGRLSAPRGRRRRRRRQRWRRPRPQR